MLELSVLLAHHDDASSVAVQAINKLHMTACQVVESLAAFLGSYGDFPSSMLCRWFTERMASSMVPSSRFSFRAALLATLFLTLFCIGQPGELNLSPRTHYQSSS
jgi:hypothetical protein